MSFTSVMCMAGEGYCAEMAAGDELDSAGVIGNYCEERGLKDTSRHRQT